MIIQIGGFQLFKGNYNIFLSNGLSIFNLIKRIKMTNSGWIITNTNTLCYGMWLNSVMIILHYYQDGVNEHVQLLYGSTGFRCPLRTNVV